MKKSVALLFASFAITALASCNPGGGNTPIKDSCKLSVYCNSGCYVAETEEHLRKVENYTVELNKSISFKVLNETDYKDLNKSNFTVTVDNEPVDSGYEYSSISKELIVQAKNVHGNLKIYCLAEGKTDQVVLSAFCNEGCKIVKEDGTKTGELVKLIDQKSEIKLNLYVDDQFTLAKENIIVRVGSTPAEESSYTYDAETKIFTMNKDYVVNNIYIIFDPKDKKPEPKEEYFINFEINDTRTIEMPAVAKAGEGLYVSFKANEKFRLPDLSNEHDFFEVRIISRRLTPNDDYVYYIDNDSIGHLYIYSGQIDGEVTISGDAIEQIYVSFNPGEGHWSSGEETTKLGVVDKGKTLFDAQKATGGETPISKKSDQGFIFSKWVDDQGQEVFSTTELTKDLNVTAVYKVSEYTTYLDFSGLNVEETRKTLKERYEFKTEIRASLVPMSGMQLPNDIKVYRNENTEWKELATTDYEYSPGKSTDNLIIPADVVTGDIKISGVSISTFYVDFNPGEGKWSDGTQDIKHGTALAGQTVRDAMHNAGIFESDYPTKDDGSVFDGWYVGAVKIDLGTKVLQNASLTAQYTSASFENDTWANVCSYANEGLDKLIQVYKPSLNTFIGKTRKVQIYSKEYTVRVIGQNQDNYNDGQGALKSAALTFEFTEAVTKTYYGMTYPKETTTGNEYINSKIRTVLNDENSGIIHGIPTDLSKNIKEVNKRTLAGGKDESTYATYIGTKEKLFVLSGSEIGITSEEAPEEGALLTRYYNYTEGDTYQYYSLYYGFEDRIKKYEGKPVECWFRSPQAVGEPEEGKFSHDSTNVYTLLTDGHYNKEMCDGGEFGVVPAFAI